MEDNYLPIDIMNDNNVWCEACEQSLAGSRANVHLASKKHAEAVARRAAATSARAPLEKARGARAAPPQSPPAAPPAKADKQRPAENKSLEKPTVARMPKATLTAAAQYAPGSEHRPLPAATSTKKAGKAPPPAVPTHGLPIDPSHPGNYWCGICKVSLTPSKADNHLATASHSTNERKVLDAAMHAMSLY